MSPASCDYQIELLVLLDGEIGLAQWRRIESCHSLDQAVHLASEQTIAGGGLEGGDGIAGAIGPILDGQFRVGADDAGVTGTARSLTLPLFWYRDLVG
ncbi:MAG: hypothetical protein H7840_11115 [Alphaproteobacteria bacterium]